MGNIKKKSIPAGLAMVEIAPDEQDHYRQEMNDNEHQENFLDECEVEMQKVEGEPGDGEMNTVDEDENDDDGPVDNQFDTGCIHQDNDMDAAGAEDIDHIDVGVDYDD